MPRLLRERQRKLLLDFFSERFRFPRQVFDSFEMFAFSRQAFLVRRQARRIDWPQRAFVRCGLPFARNVAGFLKPTTVFVQRFGGHARKNVLPLNLETVTGLCRNGEISLPLLSKKVQVPGYVIVSMDRHFLGVALALEENRLMCRFPKAMKQALERIIP